MRRTRKIVASLVASALLATTLAVGGTVPNTAWAAGEDGTGTGTLTITKSESNTVTGYEAIKIFSADVTNTGTDAEPKCVAERLAWASDEVKTAVLAAIQEYCTTHSITYNATTYEDPQNAADFMVTHIDGSDYQAIVTPDSFANVLANKLAGAVIEEHAVTAESLTAGVQKELTEGYYLVISTPTELGAATSASATSPILMLLAQGQNLSITEKVTIPTIKKTVVEDSASGTETSFADAQVGQELQFTLTGTVAGNVAGFEHYLYRFTDVLSKGMDLKKAGTDIVPADVVVKVDNTKSTTNTKATYTITEGYTVGYVTDSPAGTKTLTVEFADLKSTGDVKGKTSADAQATTVPIDSSSVVTVTYVAKLNADAVPGLETGNENTAKLTYYTYPNRTDTGTTTSVIAKVYEYALKLKKVDKAHELDANSNTNTNLAGAKFTIKATSTDESTNNGKYLKTDGTFGSTTQPAATDANYIFTTGTDGSFTVKGIDAGTYVLHEVTPPTDYKALAADLTLTLTVNKDTTTLLPTNVSTTLTGGEGDGVNTTQDQTAPPNKGTRASFDNATGTVTVVATNQKEEQLPVTGLPGITMVYVVGGVILVASLAVIVRRRVTEKE